MYFGCSKEPSHWDGSFEYPQHMFWLRIEKNTNQWPSVLSGGLGYAPYTNQKQKFCRHFLLLSVNFIKMKIKKKCESRWCVAVRWMAILHANVDAHDQKFAIYDPRHEISNNVVCATSTGSDQPAHTHSLIRNFASRLNILWLFSYWLNIIWSF